MRDTVFRLSAAAGAFIGLLWDLHRHKPATAQPSKIACTSHHTTSGAALGHCIGRALSSTLVSWLVPIGVGLVVGSLVGVLLASMIRVGRQPSRRRSQ